MEVKGNHPLSEVIACKLFGISTVPALEAERMISRACKAAVEWHESNPHPQREALDEEKVYQVLKEWQYDSDEEFVRGQAKAICAKFKSPSLSDLLSALPEKIDNITPTLMNANHVCDCYNMAIDACIAALTKRMEELNEKN